MDVRSLTLGTFLALGCASCATPGTKDGAHRSNHTRPGAEADEDDAEEIEIALADVPAAAKQAALAAVPGLVLTEAETETEGNVTLYVLEGLANGVEYEIEVTADGKVIEVESEDEDEDDGDDGDDEDEDDGDGDDEDDDEEVS